MDKKSYLITIINLYFFSLKKSRSILRNHYNCFSNRLGVLKQKKPIYGSYQISLFVFKIKSVVMHFIIGVYSKSKRTCKKTYKKTMENFSDIVLCFNFIQKYLLQQMK